MLAIELPSLLAHDELPEDATISAREVSATLSQSPSTQTSSTQAPVLRALERESLRQPSSFSLKSIEFHTRGEMGGVEIQLQRNQEDAGALPDFTLVLLSEPQQAVLRLHDTDPGKWQIHFPYFSPRSTPALRWYTLEQLEDSVLEVQLALAPAVQPRIVPSNEVIRITFFHSP